MEISKEIERNRENRGKNRQIDSKTKEKMVKSLFFFAKFSLKWKNSFASTRTRTRTRQVLAEIEREN